MSNIISSHVVKTEYSTTQSFLLAIINPISFEGGEASICSANGACLKPSYIFHSILEYLRAGVKSLALFLLCSFSLVSWTLARVLKQASVSVENACRGYSCKQAMLALKINVLPCVSTQHNIQDLRR